MKTITPFLLKFVLTATILTIVFRYFLSHGIEQHLISVIIASSVLYGISMFISGWYWGSKDGEYLPIYDVGFRFHLTTYLIHNIISELWFLFGFNSSYENIETIHYTAIIWGILLSIHFIFYLQTRKNTIDNLDRKDLFE